MGLVEGLRTLERLCTGRHEVSVGLLVGGDGMAVPAVPASAAEEMYAAGAVAQAVSSGKDLWRFWASALRPVDVLLLRFYPFPLVNSGSTCVI